MLSYLSGLRWLDSVQRTQAKYLSFRKCAFLNSSAEWNWEGLWITRPNITQHDLSQQTKLLVPEGLHKLKATRLPQAKTTHYQCNLLVAIRSFSPNGNINITKWSPERLPFSSSSKLAEWTLFTKQWAVRLIEISSRPNNKLLQLLVTPGQRSAHLTLFEEEK